MALTVSEKEYWKQFYNELYQDKIDDVRAKHPGLEGRLRDQARAEIIVELGIDKELDDIEEMEESISALRDKVKTMKKDLYEKVTGNDPNNVYYPRSINQGIENHIRTLTKARTKELMDDHEVGREIRRLQAEARKSFNAVMLASSPKQLKALAGRVAKALGKELSDVERIALEVGDA